MTMNNLNQSLRITLGLGAVSLALNFAFTAPAQADVAQ